MVDFECVFPWTKNTALQAATYRSLYSSLEGVAFSLTHITFDPGKVALGAPASGGKFVCRLWGEYDTCRHGCPLLCPPLFLFAVQKVMIKIQIEPEFK